MIEEQDCLEVDEYSRGTITILIRHENGDDKVFFLLWRVNAIWKVDVEGKKSLEVVS